MEWSSFLDELVGIDNYLALNKYLLRNLKQFSRGKMLCSEVLIANWNENEVEILKVGIESLT